MSLSGSTMTCTPLAGVSHAPDDCVYVVIDGRGGGGAGIIPVEIGS